MTIEGDHPSIQDGSTSGFTLESEIETPEQRRERIVHHLIENTSNGGYFQIDKKTTRMVMETMVDFAVAIEASVEALGGKNQALKLQILARLGSESKDQNRPFNKARAQLNSVGLQKSNYTTLHLKTFTENYMTLQATGRTTLRELKTLAVKVRQNSSTRNWT